MPSPWAKLALYVLGVYGCFLSWGILQEKISTSEYPLLDPSGEEPSHFDKFRLFLVLNLCMSSCAAALSLIAIHIKGIGLGLKDPWILAEYLKVSFTISIASPFGYESLKHINYPTVILGKSCKLLPVMLMNFLVYRKKFAWFKYVSVALVTIGVSGFMLFEPKQNHQQQKENSLFGIALLMTNLLIDGVTNSLQDKIFMRFDVRSLHMMFFMNFISSVGMLVYTCFWSGELLDAMAFIANHDFIARDILLFSFCGSLGQIFVFSLLEEFGSLTLVTVTVTRKLFTILISLFAFDHPMNPIQWVFVATVFAGIAVEAFMKVLMKGDIRIVRIFPPWSTEKQKLS